MACNFVYLIGIDVCLFVSLFVGNTPVANLIANILHRVGNYVSMYFIKIDHELTYAICVKCGL